MPNENAISKCMKIVHLSKYLKGFPTLIDLFEMLDLRGSEATQWWNLYLPSLVTSESVVLLLRLSGKRRLAHDLRRMPFLDVILSKRVKWILLKFFDVGANNYSLTCIKIKFPIYM